MRKKRAFAREVAAAGLPLTINAVIHRANIDAVEALVAEAVTLGARRIEVAHAQYYGWALKNRAALMPTAAQAAAARASVERLRERAARRDRHRLRRGRLISRRFPKPCMSGWGRRSLNVNPAGRVLPCHAAETIPGLNFWNVQRSPADGDLGAVAGLQRLPRHRLDARALRRPAPRKEIDFGGCRCQALALTGDAANTDPVCVYSPARALVAAAVEEAQGGAADLAYRRYQPAPAA